MNLATWTCDSWSLARTGGVILSSHAKVHPKLGARRSASELGHKYNRRSSLGLLSIILYLLAHINRFKN